MKRLTKQELVNELTDMWIDAHLPNIACLRGDIKAGDTLFPDFENWTVTDLKNTYENLMDEDVELVQLIKE